MTTLEAHLAGLVQLTTFEPPASLMRLEYRWPVATTDMITYHAWLLREQTRITRDPTRLAVIVEQGLLEALYVNPVAER